MKSMPGLVGFDAGQQGQPRQGQIANQIQRFVSAKFVRKA
jgi:hypothetical protein